ncbi:MAG: helix-turn-helix transcriptional regulator [Anaerolineales bacterium]|nr:helix-turn-helix transcriptional regulator [Anaerolineales bacterium]
MNIQAQVSIRTKKLGVLIRDARLATRRGINECAEAIGVTGGVFRAYEAGRRAPSLPELEVLAHFLNLPFSHFWSREAISDDPQPNVVFNLPALAGIRQRMTATLLRQARLKAGISPKSLSEQSGISTSRLKAYELGERPIPLPELEGLMPLLNVQVESFFDQSGPVGQWWHKQQAIQEFKKLPPELQDFVCKPVNRPYLELALKLSGLPRDRLRSVAENLLDITL